ncbi:hypothetical protein BpHYR1_030555 [Brachionus plicatilis]|uniref:CUB domain-containing protein n=1 Tax=Brachionus plicatilis TaxID=10195 RepID=A0A3M7SQZ6_BRAPC|nr:hypothetical protein BpHYR1_030555 [Brachionus plicatilis]
MDVLNNMFLIKISLKNTIFISKAIISTKVIQFHKITMITIKLAFLILIFCPKQFNSEKITTEPICLRESTRDQSHKIYCEDKTKRLIITTVQYTNDYLNQCDGQKTLNSTKPLKSLILCSAYPTQQIANKCNGKQECAIKLEAKRFQYGFDGSNCDFKAKILSVTFQCIPNNINQINIPKYNVCPGGVIDHPLIGFIHTPNYPSSYDSGQFCQLTLQMNEQIKRIEIFLIDLETEGLSKRHFSPTDYLQINNKEKIYGKKSFILIYNDTTDATIVFRSDLFFSQKGFFLYFEAIKKPDPIIELTEEKYEPAALTTTNVPSTNETLIYINQTEFLNEFNINENLTEIINSTNSTSLTFDSVKFESEKYASVSEITKIDKIPSNFNELKTFFANSVKYLDPYLIGNNSQFNDTSMVNGYLESNNLALNRSVVLANSSSIMENNLKRLSDDSLKLVLVKKNSKETINSGCKSNSIETYDEIGIVKESSKDTQLSKANGLVTGGQEAIDLECANKESKKTPSESHVVLPKLESAFTSTPSAPKTLPPSKNKDVDQKETDDCSYQALNKTGVKSVYRSCFDDSIDNDLAEESIQTIFKTTIEVEETLVNNEIEAKNIVNNENEFNNDYQIPSNIFRRAGSDFYSEELLTNKSYSNTGQKFENIPKNFEMKKYLVHLIHLASLKFAQIPNWSLEEILSWIIYKIKCKIPSNFLKHEAFNKLLLTVSNRHFELSERHVGDSAFMVVIVVEEYIAGFE